MHPVSIGLLVCLLAGQSPAQSADPEQLAIRTPSPLAVRVTRPVSSTHEPPALEVKATPGPVGYRAQIHVALDGGELVPVLDVASVRGAGFRLDTKLPGAASAGVHRLAVRALLTFGNPAQEGSSWTEVRDLPPLSYAVYDIEGGSSADARWFVYGPAAVSARSLDPLLGDEPFAVWLTGVLSKHRTKDDNRSGPDWVSQFCSERTDEAGAWPLPTAICSVVYFGVKGDIGQVWFRTGDVRATEDGVEWLKASPPRFEGVVILKSAPESQRLSALPMLLDTDPALRPIGDIAIAPGDIVITPDTPKPGAPVAVTITVRNQGLGDLFKVAVRVVFGASPNERGTSREFVVDLPAQSATTIKLDAAFPYGYGFVLAQAMQWSEHSPHEAATPDPTPEDACAFRIVNPRAAPPRYVDSFGDTSGCRASRALPEPGRIEERDVVGRRAVEREIGQDLADDAAELESVS